MWVVGQSSPRSVKSAAGFATTQHDPSSITVIALRTSRATHVPRQKGSRALTAFCPRGLRLSRLVHEELPEWMDGRPVLPACHDTDVHSSKAIAEASATEL